MLQAGQVALITGASAGLGRELARQLGARGLKVGLMARRTELLAEVEAAAKAAGSPATASAACDVADRASVEVAVQSLVAVLGPCDVMIANAGIGYPCPVRSFDADKTWRIYQVNVQGALNAFAAVMPAMLARKRGQLVGISSLASYRSFPESHAYCASKAALSSQLEGMRAELKPRGITVTTICPGFIKTDMTAGNNFTMPFLMECEPAVARIVGAIERRARVYNFPRRLYWAIKASRLIPDIIFDKLATPPTGKPYKS